MSRTGEGRLLGEERRALDGLTRPGAEQARHVVDAHGLYGHERGDPRSNLAPVARDHAQVERHAHRQEQRADGHSVKLPMDRGEGQQPPVAPLHHGVSGHGGKDVANLIEGVVLENS